MPYKAKTCPNCGAKEIGDDLVCRHCNTHLEREKTSPDILKVEVKPEVIVIDGDKKICPKCTTSNKEEVAFCIKCGFKLVVDCPICGEGHILGTEFCPTKGRSIKNYHIKAEIKKIKEKILPFEKEKKSKNLKPTKKNPLYESYLSKCKMKNFFSIGGFLSILPVSILGSGCIFICLMFLNVLIFSEISNDITEIVSIIITIISVLLVPIFAIVLLFFYTAIMFKLIPKKQAEIIVDSELMKTNIDRYNEIVLYMNKLKIQIRELQASMDKEEYFDETDTTKEEIINLNEDSTLPMDNVGLPVKLTGQKISEINVTIPQWRWYGPNYIFGKFILTDKEALFLPDAAEDSDEKYIHLLFKDISVVKGCNELIIYPSGMKFIMKDNKDYFIVPGMFKRGKVIRYIRDNIQRNML